MTGLALWIAAILAAVTTLTAVVKAALEVEESAKAESLGFVRLALTGVFGVLEKCSSVVNWNAFSNYYA